MGSMRRSVNFGGEGVGGGFATHIGIFLIFLAKYLTAGLKGRCLKSRFAECKGDKHVMQCDNHGI